MEIPKVSRRRIRSFDLLGIVSVVVFCLVLAGDASEFGWSIRELALEPAPDDLAAGFRPGVSWYGLYLGEAKVGFSRLERRRRGDGFAMRNRSLISVAVMANPRQITMEVESDLDPEMALRSFTASVRSPFASIDASGSWQDGRLELELRTAELEEHRSIELERPPALDSNLRNLLMRSQPSPGDRLQVDYFDPLSLTTRKLEIEYMGIDQLGLVDGKVPAHRLRQRIAGATLQSWVNDLGEVLRQELPFGVVLVRETEAEATFGIAQEDVEGFDVMQLVGDASEDRSGP
jgi:hypothetical protein